MSVTTLDPKTALVVIDLQKGLAAVPAVEPVTGIATKAAALATAFRERGLPVVLVVAAGGPPGRSEAGRRNYQFPPDWTEVLPELGQQPQDHLVTKYAWGAFIGTDLEALLKSQGVTQIVLCGVATSIGVESTAREAYSLGFNVTLASDAMTDLSLEAHANSLERIFPRLGESGSTHEIIALLERRQD
jgi:nicotinamidase-related amidase